MRIGIDMIELKRFEDAFNQGGHAFAQNHFHPEELTGRKIESIAGIFAVKEAIYKTGYMKKLDFLTVRILHNAEGRPFVYDGQGNLIKELDVSLSHTTSTVVAIAIWFTKNAI
ncbi:MAG TPA: 4'-phosphopantetheinyl transferase superfamily protein [Candidatus Woesebacteria bacterium]|jgi:phosphopantetheine--protein transferase-like protein|nr:4'-phosphopantetheinyl transferase superfamily protein [Candidatus Woesebacteria bacterium]HNS94601.1 4'-phosphopantetheinyl transferase superfamily protein [Candidatus Woesebacteria bacterium]